jgi:hypothetical protein
MRLFWNMGVTKYKTTQRTLKTDMYTRYVHRSKCITQNISSSLPSATPEGKTRPSSTYLLEIKKKVKALEISKIQKWIHSLQQKRHQLSKA